MRRICLLFVLIFSFHILQAKTNYFRALFRDDPATTMVIAWSGDGGTLHYGTTDFGQEYDLYEMQQNIDKTTGHRGIVHHFVRLENLEPATVYYFVIRDIFGEISDRMSVMTLSDDPEVPISFINGGDTRRGVAPFENCNCRKDRQDGNILVSKLRPDVIIFNGDFVRNTLGGIFPEQTNNEWKSWFDDWQLTVGPDGRLAPIVVCTGNHEDNVDALGVTDPDFNDLFKMFDVPQKDVYYSLTFGGCLFRLYSLNTEIDACTETNQLDWLTNDLQNFSAPSNTPYWKFANYHEPIIPHSDKDNQPDLYNCWAPLFRDYNVSLVMESHSHIMKTTWPIVPNGNIMNNNGFERDDENGTVYIGEGNWAAPQRSLYPPNPWTREQASIRSFFYVNVNKDSLSIYSAMFSDLDNVAQALDDELGSPMPSGVSLYDESQGADNGEILVIKNDVNSAICRVDSTMDTTGTGLFNSVKNFNSSIYPNPSSEKVFISLKEYRDDLIIEAYDARGKRCNGVTIKRESDKIYSIDAKELCSGVTFILIKSDEDIESHKFIRN